MTYRILVQRLALKDLHEAYRWAADRAPETADRWLDRFHKSLQTLENNPQRCPLARESAHVEVDLREFLFGKRLYVFRVIFIVDGETVRILRIRRAQRRFLTPAEIRNALEWDE